jgi:hypothetical protein
MAPADRELDLMPRLFVPFGEWMPDQPDFRAPGSAIITNAIPRSKQSYGPLNSLSRYSTTAMASRCQGAFAAIDNTGNVKLYTADADDLYEFESGASTFAQVSSSAGAYSCPEDQFWAFEQFGEKVYASNLTDGIQVKDFADTNFSLLSAAAPKAKYLAVVRDFVVAGFTDDVSYGTQPQRVWWSGINNPTSWETPGSSAALAVQSDFNDTAGNHGWLQGIVPKVGYADACLFFERAIYRMQYQGYPTFFRFDPAEGVRGTPAPYSIVQLGAVCYYYGEDGFYAFDGSNSTPIGAGRVDRTFANDVDYTYFSRMQGAVDPVNKIIIWGYPRSGSSGALTGVLCYSPTENRWTRITGFEFEFISRMLSIGYSLEGLAAVFPDLDAITVSLDSRAWTGGKILIAAFDTSHYLNYFTGTTLAASIETPEVQLNPNGRAALYNTRPAVDNAEEDPTAPGTVSVAGREMTISASAYGDEIPINTTFGTAPQHKSARYHRARLTCDAGAAWTHAQGIEMEFSPLGAR